MTTTDRKTYIVEPNAGKWRAVGPDVEQQFGNRDEAIALARKHANENQPSHLKIHMGDGRLIREDVG